MKVLLLNDTSWYHYGCKEVIKVLSNYYNPTMLIDNRDEINTDIIEDFDLVVLNGEGTLHHNAPWAKKFLGYLKVAQEMGKQTHLVNSVWQEMGNDWDNVLQRCDVVEVREVLSKNEMSSKNGKVPEVVLDASFHSETEYIQKEFNEVCLGGSFNNDLEINWDDYHRIDIFKMKWDDLVNTLRNSKLLITGRHHELYAALQARTPVMVVSGNTWKNEGFFHTAGVPELIMNPSNENISQVLNGTHDQLWNKVWNFLENCNYKYR